MKRRGFETVTKACLMLGYSARVNNSNYNFKLIERIREYEGRNTGKIKYHNKNLGLEQNTTLRKCLKCEVDFASKSNINRLCNHCRVSDD